MTRSDVREESTDVVRSCMDDAIEDEVGYTREHCLIAGVNDKFNVYLSTLERFIRGLDKFVIDLN